jgi:GNAT superfamily N-acetyltransferase
MQLQLIHTTDTVHYAFVEKLLTDSFPPNEYRDLTDFQLFTDNNLLFHNNIILEKDKLIGFLSYWNFVDFYYVEHFAIEKSMRGKGYGAFSLFLLKRIVNVPIVLEVEPPINHEALRRIRFYRRQGFELWNNYYEQPPYRPTDKPYPMLLMVYGGLNSEKDFNRVKQTIYREVYNIKQ